MNVHVKLITFMSPKKQFLSFPHIHFVKTSHSITNSDTTAYYVHVQ